MEETIVESVITGKLDRDTLIKWLNNEEIEGIPEDCVLLCCNRNDFVAHFITYLRTQTENIFHSNALQIIQPPRTPEKLTKPRRKHCRSISDPTNEKDRSAERKNQESPSTERKKRTRVKTKLFNDERKEPVSPDDSRISVGMERLMISSTPVKNGTKSEYPNLLSPVSPGARYYERCDTPRSHRHSKSSDKSINFGDYLVTAQRSSKKKKSSKNTSSEVEDSKVELDLSNSEMFPEIGAKKSTSKRRVKPLQIDTPSQKSVSLSSFSPEYFQQPSPLALQDNAAFKYVKIQPNDLSHSYERERNMLKQEKQKVMEIFNSTSSKSVAPQIKILQKDTVETQNYVKADANKVKYKEKIDTIVEIYDVMIKNNLILSFVTEVYFLISIILAKQTERDYDKNETKMNDNNIHEYLFKIIHNSTYFAVKSLWMQRAVLEVVLDKNSSKNLGENKTVRSYSPELAKCLLNSYGLKCEEEVKQETVGECNSSSNIVRFNQETDNADNFPTLMSFQNFKKQRDMFYEILRGYHDAPSSGTSKMTFRSRIKTLLSCGQTAANYAHLSALFMANMCAECLTPNYQESRLSKLKRRFTCPVVPESHRLPTFAPTEMFYKDFIVYTDNEAFRVHLRDALAAEILALDSTPFANEDRSNNSNTSDMSKDYLMLCKKLRLLAKFLGYLTSLPYTYVSMDVAIKNNLPVTNHLDQLFAAPKERVLENNIASRDYHKPNLDVKGMLINAIETGRLLVTIPWLVQYLSMVDYVGLRLKYYRDIIKHLLSIYTDVLKMTDEKFKKNTIIFLKATLGWLFDLPHFPQTIERVAISVASDMNIDCYDLIDEAILFELCPYLRDVGVLLSTCKMSQDQKDMSFKHVTPITLVLKPEDFIKNKEKELQSKLEEEFLRSQPASTRRVLEVVVERVSAASVREAAGPAGPLAAARRAAADRARCLLRAAPHDSSQSLLEGVEGVYRAQLGAARARALEAAGAAGARRCRSALGALLPAAPPPLCALAARSCAARVKRWLHDNWNTTAVLCKDIEAEMKNLIGLGEYAPPSPKVAAGAGAALLGAELHPSPAAALINLKEHIACLLEGEEPADVTSLARACAASCEPTNVFSRPPTQRAIFQLSVDLCIVYVSQKPKCVTEEFLNKLHNIWNTCCPERKRNKPKEIEPPERRESIDYEDERAPTPISDEEVDTVKVITEAETEIAKAETQLKDETQAKAETQAKPETQANAEIEDNPELLGFFDRVLCPRNIVLLSASKSEAGAVWGALAAVLVYLLNNDYLSEESLTEQCLAVYSQEWPPSVQEHLSTCMKAVSTEWSKFSVGKLTLVLDFMSEYCRDMEYE